MTTSKMICPLQVYFCAICSFAIPNPPNARINGNIIKFRENESPFPSAAARSEAEETISKRPKSLLKDLNGADTAVHTAVLRRDSPAAGNIITNLLFPRQLRDWRPRFSGATAAISPCDSLASQPPRAGGRLATARAATALEN